VFGTAVSATNSRAASCQGGAKGKRPRSAACGPNWGARTMMARAPVLEICNSLLASDHDPRKPLEALLRLAAVGAAASSAGGARRTSGPLSSRVVPVNINLHVDWRCMPGSGSSPRSARSRPLGVRGRGLTGFARDRRFVAGSGDGGAALPTRIKHLAEWPHILPKAKASGRRSGSRR
jgi:hypothetical protein